MRALGADNALIAECLDIDADAVATLLEIGLRKLDGVEQRRPLDDGSTARGTLEC